MGVLSGKVAVVTGASKGIGAGIAKGLAATGADVVVNYASSRSDAERVVGAIRAAGGRAIAVQADIAKDGDVARLFSEAVREFGRLDVLVNNAGVYQFAPLEAITEAEFRRQLDTNVIGLTLATQEAVKHFGPDGGSVINISSIVSTNDEPASVVYSATKAAVDAITRVLARELGPKKIRVNSINPGATETEGLHRLGVIGSEFERQVVARTPLGVSASLTTSLRRRYFWPPNTRHGLPGRTFASPEACDDGRADEDRRGRSMKVKKALPVAVVVVAMVGGLLAWRIAAAAGHGGDAVLPLSGRIEADDSAIAPKTSGRIVEIRVREGDSVQAGDVIARLDDQQVRARAEQARLAVTAADARVQAAQRQAAVLEEQLRQSELQTGQANLDASGRVQQAEADLAAAEADLARQEAANRLALFDKDAYTKLAESGAVSERQGKQAIAAADQQAAAVVAATRRVEAARGALVTARANLANERIRHAQTAGIRQQIAQQRAEIASATANVEHERAQLHEAEANLNDLLVTAPFAGTVLTRSAEPGEVVQGGTPIVTLVDLAKVYLRGYVPEGQIGHVKIGQAARVYLDSAPDRPVDAVVSRVDPQATFTPENTYFRDDRVKQVIGLKLQLKGGFGLAKPGMPADGEILVGGTAWPSASR